LAAIGEVPSSVTFDDEATAEESRPNVYLIA
jgi:hypothetical protein